MRLSANPGPINLSRPRHTAITPVLREFVYQDEFTNRELPIVFSDGSRPPSFPIGVLQAEKAPPNGNIPTISLGLISFRHLDMDFLVDAYLLTNNESDRSTSIAAQEKLAFDSTVTLMNDPAIANGAVIRMFQTGLEPVVVGFYRGVLHCLMHRVAQRLPRTMVIIPCLFAESTSEGPYSEKSPGALEDSYIQCEPWW